MDEALFSERKGLCLIRHLDEGEPRYLGVGNTLDPACITITSGRLGDLSNNLLGVFQVEDIFFGICKGVENKDWEESHGASPPPADGEWYRDDSRKFYFIPVEDVVSASFPDLLSTNGEHDTFHFRVLHTPVKYNFWHVSIRVFDSKGRHVQTFPKNAAKRVHSRLRDYLVGNIVRTEPPEYVVLTPECWVGGGVD